MPLFGELLGRNRNLSFYSWWGSNDLKAIPLHASQGMAHLPLPCSFGSLSMQAGQRVQAGDISHLL